MNIKPEELVKNGYVLYEKLEHKNLIEFLKKYSKQKSKFYKMYYFFIIAISGLIGILFGVNSYDIYFSSTTGFTHLCYGFAISLCLIPVHEFIHVLAYKSQGAMKTSYDVNLKKFYFMALADKFVANKKEFTIVALAPFVSITVLLGLLFFIVNLYWVYTIYGAILFHSLMCSGDFGILNYMELNKDKNMVTYDDVENKTSYFYIKEL